jgi:hypothetical protein
MSIKSYIEFVNGASLLLPAHSALIKGLGTAFLHRR